MRRGGLVAAGWTSLKTKAAARGSSCARQAGRRTLRTTLR